MTLILFIQTQVYVQIEVLFKDAPGLIAELKGFVPEAEAPGTGRATILP